MTTVDLIAADIKYVRERLVW